MSEAFAEYIVNLLDGKISSEVIAFINMAPVSAKHMDTP